MSKEACAAGKRRKDTIRPLLIVQAQAADLKASRSLDVRNTLKVYRRRTLLGDYQPSTDMGRLGLSAILDWDALRCSREDARGTTCD